MVRDKSGNVVVTHSTLLPGGNKRSAEKGRTLMQGVYSVQTKTLYVTDLIMWNDELVLDMSTGCRLMAAFERVLQIPNIGTVLSEDNEVRVRLPNMYDCTRQTLCKCYCGAYADVHDPAFPGHYEALAEFAKTNDMLKLLKLEGADLHSPAATQRLCSAFAYDTANSPYLKDGLAFVHREGLFAFGYSEECLQWKDSMVSPYFESLARSPSTGTLFSTSECKLMTYDGYEIQTMVAAAEMIKPNCRYAVEYDEITSVAKGEEHGGCATLEGLKMVKESERTIWSPMSKLIFKCLARKSLMTFEILVQQVSAQESTIPPPSAQSSSLSS